MFKEPEYPDDWEDRRNRVLIRDKYTCKRCKKVYGKRWKMYLRAHHKKGRSHSLENLETICWKCHKEIHPHLNKNKRSKKVVKRILTWRV